MKKILLPACLLFFVMAQAQMKEGRIIYERTVRLPVRAFNADPEIASQLPKTRTDQFELLFGNNQSLWQYLPGIGNEDPGTISGNGVVLRFASGANDVSYCNFDKRTRTDQREKTMKGGILMRNKGGATPGPSKEGVAAAQSSLKQSFITINGNPSTLKKG